MATDYQKKYERLQGQYDTLEQLCKHYKKQASTSAGSRPSETRKRAALPPWRWLLAGVLIYTTIVAAVVWFSYPTINAWIEATPLVVDTTLTSNQRQDTTQVSRQGPPQFPVVVKGQFGFIDRFGNLRLQARFTNARPFTEGLAAVKRGGAWGYIDTTGSEVITPRFDAAFSFFEDRALVIVDNQRGFIQPDGSYVVRPRYGNSGHFSEGLAVVSLNQQYGYINREGQEVIALQYEAAFQFFEGYAIVRLRGKDPLERAFIDTSGRLALRGSGSQDYINAYRVSQQRAPVQLRHSNRWGYIDVSGAFVLPATFEEAHSFSEGLARIAKSGFYGFIEMSGAEVIPPTYREARDFSEGFAAVRINKNFGYIDRQGTLRIEARFDEAFGFDSGLAKVVVDGAIGYIDTAGSYVWPLKR